MYKRLSAAATVLAVFVIPAIASAHVIVMPAQAGIGVYQKFQTNVPNEKDSATVALKLLMPAGAQSVVIPAVKTGWTINTVKTGDNITEIDWTGGSIPVGQEDEFDFTAQTPAKATTLDWKAYQTYADGTVVHWDEKPTGSFTDGTTPYSTTKIVNDLTSTPAVATAAKTTSTRSNDTLGLVFGLVAIVISIYGVSRSKKQ